MSTSPGDNPERANDGANAKIELAPRDVRFVERIADDWVSSYPDFRPLEVTCYKDGPMKTFIKGLKAEMAVAIFYDLKIDVETRAEGDETDFVIGHDGDIGTLDVKAMTYNDGKLMIREGRPPSDWYLQTYLESAESNTVWLCGFVSREEVENRAGIVESPRSEASHNNYLMYLSEMNSTPGSDEIEAVADRKKEIERTKSKPHYLQ